VSSNLFRVYSPDELGPDGYSPEWHATIKHAVREEAGHRCVRCGHPYVKGAGEWSPCDELCYGNDYHPFGDPHTRTRWEYEGESGEGIEIIEARWRILTVHHLTIDKADCRWWNLVALCQRCHLQIQGKVRMARVWPWEHSEWFKSYAAGWYAATYLGEELSRTQVEARMDELLSLERVA